MISTAYLHEHDILDTFLEETHHLMNDVYDAQNRLFAAENYIDEQIFMGESASDYEIMLEETKKNVFTRIGEKVIEWVDIAIDKLKEIAISIGNHLKRAADWQNKAKTDEALKTQMEKDPELAKKFIDSVMSGNIKAHDVKDMDDLLKTAQELADKLESGKIDEKTYMDKVDEKLAKYAERSKNIQSILGIVTTAASVLTAIYVIRSNGAEVRAKAKDAESILNGTKQKAQQIVVNPSPVTVKVYSDGKVKSNQKVNPPNDKNGSSSSFIGNYMEKGEDSGNTINTLLQGQRKIMMAFMQDMSAWNIVAKKADEKLESIVSTSSN